MNSPSRVARSLIWTLCTTAVLSAASGSTQPAASASSADLGWPRQYGDGTAKLVLYQPQVDTWTNFQKLTARLAASLTINKTAEPVWGVLSIASETVVDLEARTVTLGSFGVTGISYPSAKDRSEAEAWQTLTTKLLPAHTTTVALDHVMAYMDKDHFSGRQTEVLLAPPPILVSTQPAVLVIIDGKPVPVDIEKTDLQKIVNTNWDLFFDKKARRYYLRDDKVWFFAKELTDAWMPVTKLPNTFFKLPATEPYKEVLHSIAQPQKHAIAKLVIVVDKPAELIVLAGEPVLAAIPDTRLMWVTNTECDLFLDAATRHFYFLTSGRWFSSSELRSNQWVAATTSLPIDFKKIPADHPRGHILSSVPGTRYADEAVLNASIPQFATISRKSVKAEVIYVGDPKFEPIADTGVTYAINTPNDVFHFNDEYYQCLDGVWLVAREAHGPWEAADKIPQEIYSIPADSPKHHVTYVNVYDSTEDTVTYGHTAGYMGVYVGYGVAMWGTGYNYPPYYGYGYYRYPVYWPCSYYTYGASAWYDPATRAYRRGSAVYGPYGGFARSYKRDQSGQWYKNNGGSWESTNHPTPGTGQADRAELQSARPTGTQDSAVSRESIQAGGLDRDASARRWGDYEVQRSQSTQRSSSWNSSGMVGRGSSGWSTHSPGFGGGWR